jgi:hypothetical protein
VTIAVLVAFDARSHSHGIRGFDRLAASFQPSREHDDPAISDADIRFEGVGCRCYRAAGDDQVEVAHGTRPLISSAADQFITWHEACHALECCNRHFSDAIRTFASFYRRKCGAEQAFACFKVLT